MAALWLPKRAVAAVPQRAPVERKLAFHDLHTGESFSAVYRVGGRYVPEAIAEMEHLLRDFRTGEQTSFDRRLFDLLHRLQHTVGRGRPYQVISGYRSPKTNAMLAARSGGVAKRSYHMKGMAIDVRVRGVSTRELREAALKLRKGGVGYYPKSDFVHLDVGPVRHW
jgi:uncharacterized protein YcbK (DUF882 family)